MNSGAARAGAGGSEPPAGCAAFDADRAWDEPPALRGEILSAERLTEHAVEIARAQGEPARKGLPRLLWQRFVSARANLRQAYEVLKGDVQNHREPSPAEEWLLDNSHVIEEQFREIEEDLPRGYLRELPRLASGKMRGCPAVYGLCLDYLRHTDARVDLHTLAGYVRSFQTVRVLTIGELWAVPIMLRLGLLLTVSAIAAAETRSRDRARGDEWAERLLAASSEQAGLGPPLAELERGMPITAAFLVQLTRRLREHDEPSISRAFDWITAQAAKLGATPEELFRRQLLRQAADQVSVGNAVTSMRAIAAFDWHEFFEKTSAVEALLTNDPSGAYAGTDPKSRDRYRHAVEALARQSGNNELGVAQAALELARRQASKLTVGSVEAHVGYYLLDDGRRELERRIAYRQRFTERCRRAVTGSPSFFYFAAIGAVLAALWGGVALALMPFSSWAAVALLVPLVLLASEVAVDFVNGLVVSGLRPRLLPRLDFRKGIPAEFRTLVAVPALLDSPGVIDRLLEDLEVRSLANSDPNLRFALVTDFVEADREELPEDAELLERVEDGIALLNERYGGRRFWLFHRRRVENRKEGQYLGWDRKRGKLEELNRLLRGATDTSFSHVIAETALFSSIRYVLTLDADTELPRDTAQKLVATLAHPLNRAVPDLVRHRIARGYAILQPRVGTLPESSRRSRFAAIAAGPSGIDPYTTAVSDVYQDLFAEGSYVGKGIYDVDAFTQVLEGRIPENLLLSHDLFEGLYARSALVTDVEVLDEQPAAYEVQSGRQHRWIRGDWQLIGFLFPRVPERGGGSRPNDLRLIDRWKLFDNLRRSLLAPAMVLTALLGWFGDRRSGIVATVMLGTVLLAPVLLRLLFQLARDSRKLSPASFGALGGDLRTNLIQAWLGLVVVFDQALVSVDAIARTLYRLVWSKRRLLEWRTMRQSAGLLASSGGGPIARRTLFSAVVALALGFGLWAHDRGALVFAGPVLACWALSPVVVAWLSRDIPRVRPGQSLSEADRRLLHGLAGKTWRYFETFVTKEDNFLPPDNYQQDPRGVVAHRTSPTNIGLYLLSVVSARDLGYLTLEEVRARLKNTFDTLERMERRSGHILNWYDTETLRPLDPQYVSTVDSGNLASALWTLRQACDELCDAPLLDPELLSAARALLHSFQTELGRGARTEAKLESERLRLERALAAAGPKFGDEPAQSIETLLELARMAGALLETARAAKIAEPAELELARVDALLGGALSSVRELLPFAELLRQVPPELELGAPGFAAVKQALLGVKSLVSLRERGAEARLSLASLYEALSQTKLGVSERARSEGFLRELEERLERGWNAGERLDQALRELGRRATALADGMDFSFLFDESRELFVTGYNVGSARLDTSHYDLLASEARVASLVAIAKGDVPQEHWFRLGRPRTAVASRRCLLSWSGSMFEFLMPLLVTKNHPDTLLHETCESAVIRQKRYGAEHGVPWGVSESAYNLMDFGMTYQYRAFGVPGLGLKAGLGEDLVITPYATALAAMVHPELAIENLRALSKAGLDGPYGHYEAIDYTPAHVPPGRKSVIVKSFMAHHQGMTLVSLANVLNDFRMVERFHRDVRIKASELLLEERVPARAPLVRLAAAAIITAPHGAPELELTEHVGLASDALPRLHLLGHGELSTLVSATGTGVTSWKGIDVNRFREDPLLESGGIYVYVRNLSSQKCWSSSLEPSCEKPDSYDVAFSVDRVEFHRRDGEVETITQVLPSPEHAAEVRRLTLTNHGSRPIDLDLTSYTEIVLAPRGADLAHRAFGNLFVQTEALPERRALLARRRPRSPSEPEVWLVQLFVGRESNGGPFEFETSRERFVGRGNDLTRPSAMSPGASLSGSTGYVLDPIFSLRRKLRLLPGKPQRCTLVTALASSREEALSLVEAYTAPHAVFRTFELAWADARVELKHLGITAAEVHRFQRLLSAVIYPRPGLRERSVPRTDRPEGRAALYGLGLSGDLPILVFRMDQSDFGDSCRELLLAHEYWRLNGISVDLVLLNEEPSGYAQPSQEAALGIIRATRAEARIDQRGGVHLRKLDTMSEEQQSRLLGVARVVLLASRGSIARQLRAASEQRPLPGPLVPSKKTGLAAVRTPTRPSLAFDNGVGGFDESGREYVIVVQPKRAAPAPWCNVFANAEFGAVISELGAGYTWFGNSQRHRLTPWSNDAVQDPSGELVYVRDDEDGSVWSPTPRPLGAGEHFIVRHGQGYSSFEHGRGHLHQLLTVFVARSAPVKVYRLRLVNQGSHPRRLSVFGIVEWVLGSNRETSRTSVVTAWDRDAEAVLSTNPLAALRGRHAFFTSTRPVRSFTADREEVFGLSGNRRRPRALEQSALSGRYGAGLDPCAALQVSFELQAGESLEFSFVLGDAESSAAARALALEFGNDAAVARAFDQVVDGWDELLGTVRVKTPDAALDLLVNRWLLYQATSCRLWGRSGFYQSSGAFGFRDQLQDVLALLHARPDIARAHLLLCASRQFVEGDVQHWWHPDAGDGVRTRCSDDLLWLPYAAAEYVRVTGDAGVMDEHVEFLVEKEVPEGQDDLFSIPRPGHGASLYEHCLRALERGATVGPHGLPKIGSCDWNDGMNRVGVDGAGESVWLAWFLAKTLDDFASVASARGDAERALWCERLIQRLAAAVDAEAWDGEWYRRAYFDDGAPLGTHSDSECRIDAIAQSWAVIAGVGQPERAALAVSRSLDLLVRQEPKTMLLLTPPFEHSEHDPGYIMAYPPGIRENGGQYTHGVLWTLEALARLGDGERVGHLLNLLNPIQHARTPEDLERYRVEPYVVAADVYSASGHEGRGGWTWYTGSAAWMYRIVLESVLGFRRRGETLTLAPCVPKTWQRFEIEYRHRGRLFSIRIENPNGKSSGVCRVEVDGAVVADGSIRLDAPGERHDVRVVLGDVADARAHARIA